MLGLRLNDNDDNVDSDDKKDKNDAANDARWASSRSTFHPFVVSSRPTLSVNSPSTSFRASRIRVSNHLYVWAKSVFFPSCKPKPKLISGPREKFGVLDG